MVVTMNIRNRFWLVIMVSSLSASVLAQSEADKLRNVRPEDIDLKALDAVVAHNADTKRHVAGTSQQVLSWQRTDGALSVATTGGTLMLEPLQGNILHVSYGDANKLAKRHSYIVENKPSADAFKAEEHDGRIVLSASGLVATIDKRDGHIALATPTGQLLVSEKAGGARANAVGDSVAAYTRFALTADEPLYGLGEFRDGRLNLRHCQRELVQFNTQSAVPVVYSPRGWGLLWDNDSRTIYLDNADGMSLSSDYGDIVDYYLFVGNTMDSLVASYRKLTGQAPMLPLWAMGYHQSRNRYHNWKELFDVARGMKQRHIPMGSIFIDYHYWGKYGTGSMRFDEASFPDVAAHLDTLHNQYDTHAVITMWPCFKPGTTNYELLSSKGMILEGARAIDGYIYDVFNPEARKLYRQLIRPLLHTKVDGWFLDGPEPDHIQSFLPTQTYLGPAQRVRNLYPLLHTANFFKALQEERPGERPYMLTRCAFAGQQRYGTAVWSGDIPTTFDELRLQVAAGLNFTATGIPYWTTDIGGYSGGNPKDTAYRELFARWFQYGTFCPIFRAHGRRYPGNTTGENELWSYGDTIYNICKHYVDLRYSLMPYIYSLSAMVNQRGYTPMRLLAFDFATDKKTIDMRDEFMYGPAFLVCPVLEAGATSREVYLPEGCKWYDYHTGKAHTGGTTITTPAPLEHMPLFVKAGSIVPMADGKVEVYPGTDAQFRLYSDDGHTNAYQQGQYSVVPMAWDDATRTLTLGAHEGQLKPGKQRLSITVKGTGTTRCVTYKGKETKIRF